MSQKSIAIYVLVLTVLAGIQPSLAQSYSIDLEILNIPNDAGELVVVVGSDIAIEFTVDDPAGELDKSDEIELYVIDSGELVAGRTRGKHNSGVVSLNASQQYVGSYVGVRYVQNGQPLATVPDMPVLILADEGSLLLFDRLTSFCTRSARPVYSVGQKCRE